MIQASYSELIKKISESSGLSLEEIEKRVDEKKVRLSDLISREGAAQIVAAELGVSFDKQKSDISGLLIGMKKASVVAKITKIFPARSFKTKNGAEGKVCNLTLADSMGIIRCVLWDVKHIKLLEEGEIKEGDVVEVKDASVKQGLNGKEIHLGSFSAFNKSTEVLDKVISFEEMRQKLASDLSMTRPISELRENERSSVRAAVLQAFEPKFFYVCPECGKKPAIDGEKYNCLSHGNVIPKERSLMTFVIDDGSGNMKAVCFNETITQIFGIEEGEVRGLGERKNEILGKEFLFSGRVKKNQIFDTLEFSINSANEVNPHKLVEELNSH